MVFRDDMGESPIRLRINYYILFFLGLIFILLPLTGLSLTVWKQLAEARTTRKLETRRALMTNLRMVIEKKKLLIETAGDQIQSYRDLLGSQGTPALLPLAMTTVNQPGGETATDSITEDISDLKHLRDRAHYLLDEDAYFSLQQLWNRLTLYSEMPRGRPLPSGIGNITSPFGYRVNPFNHNDLSAFHTGIDFAAAPLTPIIATAPGRVIQVFDTPQTGYGIHLLIHHGNGYVTLYGHNTKNLVQEGDVIHRGQVIALMGRTGAATGYHVHYEVRFGASPPYDPLEYVQIK